MTDDSTPEAAHLPEFPTALRGYERSAVDGYVGDLHTKLAEAEAELSAAAAAIAGEDGADPEAIRRELEAVGSEVAAILDAARSAADAMRARAAEDAARWRADADREAREMRKSTETATAAARGDAWETATEILEQASRESEALLESARQDALYIRAEAEREAVRLTGDARRDAEEAVRAGRLEAERLTANAKAEAQTSLDNARRSAEQAQERARALERRRGELMEELEQARRSIGEFEEGAAGSNVRTPPAASPDQDDAQVAPAPEKAPSEWLDGDASVRIVPAATLPAEEPVDADSFVAEVEQLRSMPESSPEPEPVPAGEWLDVLDGPESEEPDIEEPDIEEPELVEPELVEPGSAPADVAAAPDSIAVVDSEEADIAGEPASDPAAAESGAASLDSGEGDGSVGVEPEPPAAADAEASADDPEAPRDGEADQGLAEESAPGDLDSLFATLRDPAAADTVDPEPLVEAVETAEREVAEENQAAPSGGAVAVVDAEDGVPDVVSVAALDPFDLRERMLLPIENRALRSVKRRIVDLQNRILEELRLGDDDWLPDRALFAASIGDDVALLTQESYVAGYAAAAELMGVAATPPPDHGADQESTTEFVDAALNATQEALTRARATGGGTRQVSAALSRVFRAWRTDEAERRLRRAGSKAYHSGVLDAMPGLGVTTVAAIAVGSPCGACPAGTGATWRPGGPLPSGTQLPPATAACTATIVPTKAD